MEKHAYQILDNLDQVVSVLKRYKFSNYLFFKWAETLKTLDNNDNDFEIERDIIRILSSKDIKSPHLVEIDASSLALLLLFIEKNKEVADFYDLKNLQRLEQEIKKETTPKTFEEALHKMHNYLEAIEVDKTKAVIKIKRSLKPLYFLLTLSFLFLLVHNLTDSTIKKEEYAVFFVLSSTLITAAFLKINNFYIKKYNQRQLASFHHKVKIQSIIGYKGYIVYSISCILIPGILYILEGEAMALASVITILTPAFFLLGVSAGKLPIEDIRYSLKENIDLSFTIDEEENDDLIVILESKIAAFTSKLEAYVLESALFGALAFSGFLTIMAEDLISFEQFEVFTKDAVSLISGLIQFDFKQLDQLLINLTTKQSTFILVSILSLISSIFFMVVIASRLRLSSILDKTNRYLNLAVVYNDKENELIHEASKHDASKFSDYNRKITDYLRLAYQNYLQIDEVSSFMLLFRASGVISFFIVLITSALLVSNFLSILFLILSIIVIIFFNKKEIEEYWNSTTFNVRVRLYNNLSLLTVAAFIILGVTIVLNYSNQSLANLLLFISFMTFVSYRFFELFIVKRSVVTKKVQRLNGVRFSWLFAEICMFFALYFYILRLPGAAILIVLAIGFVTFTALNVLRILISNKIIRAGVIVSCVILNIGLMFKVLHLPGANYLYFSGLASICIIMLLQLLLKIKIYRLELYFAFILVLVFGVKLFPDQVMLSYQSQVVNRNDLERLADVKSIVNSMHRGRGGNTENFDEKISQLNEEINWYDSKYQTTSVLKKEISEQLLGISAELLSNEKGEVDSSKVEQLLSLAAIMNSQVEDTELYKDFKGDN